MTIGDALEGIIAELAALVIHRYDAAAGAQHHAAIGGTAGVLAIFTARLDVVSVQFAAHRCPPFLTIDTSIAHLSTHFQSFFRKSQKNIT